MNPPLLMTFLREVEYLAQGCLEASPSLVEVIKPRTKLLLSGYLQADTWLAEFV